MPGGRRRLAAVALHRWGWQRLPAIGVAKLAHSTHDPYRMFRMEAATVWRRP